MTKKIGIACDHAGYETKEYLVGLLGAMGYEVLDFGCNSPESIDYPDFAHPLAEAIEGGELTIGVGLCGSGQGMAMTLNKHQAIRAALCWNEELAALARQHNDSNVLVLPARFIDNNEATAIVKMWLATPFEGGRHIPRVEKIAVK
ncbi:MAG: ribose 5-phosphate isomerase B [Rikenellaceae bacterium]